MEKTKEEITMIIIEELTQKMAEDGQRVGAPVDVITKVINAAQPDIASLADKIVNKIL